MTQFNFKGDINGISDRQLEFILNIIQELGFEDSKVTFEPVGKAGDNYAASVKRIFIQGGNSDMTIVVKIAPSVELYRQLMNSALVFRNEHVMYTEVLPKFVQLQKDAGIPENEQLKHAKCYGSLSEQPNEVILLEDLKPLNFIMLDRFQPLSNECVKSILKNFATFHSLSFALKYKEPHTYEHFKTTLKDMWVFQVSAKPMKMFFQGLEEEALAILENPNHINLVKYKVTETMNIAANLSKTENDKYTVILQGDAWTNNIMFKMEGDKVLESIMIDYQLSRNSSPVVDVMYMIFNCTDYESRKLHFYDWLDYYHSELDKSLSDFNLKANFVYPRDKFDADLKRYGKFIFGLGIPAASMMIRKSDDAAKVMASMETFQEDIIKEQLEVLSIAKLRVDKETNVLYKNKVLGLIESFIEFGLL